MKKLLYFLIPIVIITLIYFSLSRGGSKEEYRTYIQGQREEKENYLKNNSESPFVLSGLEVGEFSYFPIDRKYRVSAKVEKITKRQIAVIQNSDGSSQRYLKYAWLHFSIDGNEQKLIVLKPVFGVGLFLGFADETSGDTSYGGGRYLEIGEIKGDRINLDFNLAYIPYCAYSAIYQCPFPPKENILNVKIEAGEKDYSK